MRFVINSLFVEPDCTFNVSGNVRELVTKKLEEVVIPSNSFLDKYNDFDFGFTISTKKEIENIFIQGPLIDKKEKEIYYTIWMPFVEISESEKYLESYLDNLFKGILLAFEKHEFEVEKVKETFKSIKQQILKDSQYTYSRKSWNIDDFLDDLEIFKEP